MSTNKEIVTRMPKHSIGEDCVQLIIGYKKSLTLLNPSGILYYDTPFSSLHINKYLEDERRKQFPYSTIPIHRSKIGLSKCIYTNQLLNYDEPYINIIDGGVVQDYVVKDGDSALIISKVMDTIQKVKYMTREELEKLFKKPTNENQDLYVMNVSGEMYDNESSELIPSEEQLVEMAKAKLLKPLDKYISESKQKQYYQYFNKFDLTLLERCINNMNVDSIPEDTSFMDDDLLLIKTNNSDISIQAVSIRFMKQNYYKVLINDLPVNKYILEQIKFLTPKIKPLKSPNIISRLNPGVSKEEIKNIKRKVKEIDKKTK